MGAEKERVVVIGAGPGGLAAAMLLAADGADVTVLEKAATPGGRSGSIREDGFTFDVGPTFFLYPEILEQIFAACGRNLFDEVAFKRLDPMYRITFEGGGAIDATADLERMKGEIAKLSPRDAEQLPGFMEDNRRKFELFKPSLQRAFSSPLDFLDGNFLKAAGAMRPHLSVDADLRRFFEDPRTRQAFSFQTKYLGMSPFQCPSLFTILALLEYDYGVLHPVGGCGAVVRRMAEICAEMGVDIRYETPARGFVYDGKRVVGVKTDAGAVDARSVFVNADFAHAMGELVPDERRPAWTDEKLAKKRFSCSTFMLYLGIEGTVDLPHHSIVLSEDFEGNIDDIQERMLLPKKPSFYVCNPSPTDPTMAPEGKSALYVLVPVPHVNEKITWSPATTDAMREHALNRIEATLGVSDLRPRIVYEKRLTPVSWRDELSVYKGATFNLAHTLDQMLLFRPRNRFAEIPGLYLVGGGTHPGSGLPVIFESARISTGLWAEDRKRRRRWSKAAPPATLKEAT